MQEETYLSLLNLKEELKKDERVQNLLILEKEMEEDEEVQLLSYKKDLLADEYNSLLKIYKEDEDIVLKARHNLHLAKKILEEHPKVRTYLSAFSELRKLLEEVSDILFSDFSLKLCKK
jgi:cell fate (sporulation/competence/biofilm development) regulator YlbF (YheA/YmcA/DUF963 family)